MNVALDEPSGASDKETIRRALEQQLHDLPVLPTAVARLLSLDRTQDSYFDDVVAVVRHEPNYAVKLLSFANSAAVRGRQPITKIHDAVVRMGAKGASALIVALSVTRVFVPTNPWEVGLWLHALHVAALSRCLAALAPQHAVDPEEAYLSGLLHDVGRFILFNEAPDALKHVDEADWSSPAEMVAAESSICGLNHAELGARAAELWSLPQPIASVIRNHHASLSPAGKDPLDRLTALVQVADRVAFLYNSPEHALAQPLNASTSELLAGLLPPWYTPKPAVVSSALDKALKESRAEAKQLLPWAGD